MPHKYIKHFRLNITSHSSTEPLESLEDEANRITNSEHESIHPAIKSTHLRIVPMSKKLRRELLSDDLEG